MEPLLPSSGNLQSLHAEDRISLINPIGAAYYARSDFLTAQFYQDLLDRGWRRSGKLLYKPDVLNHCCPHYTIRLDTADFKPTKEQRQALNRWSRFIVGEDYSRICKTLYPQTKEEKARQRNEFDLAGSVYDCEYARLKQPPEPAHRFEVTLESNEFTQEKFALFEKYQQIVHHEAPSVNTPVVFKQFCCESPLIPTTILGENGVVQKIGSFHQCYRLDGKLIAVGVVDLLPQCVSAVYFMYTEDVQQWNLGKVGTMREILLAIEGSYRYYYMGYYIPSCAKMLYKANYAPQSVLDPVSYLWSPLDGLDSSNHTDLPRENPMSPSEVDEDNWMDWRKSIFHMNMPGIPSPDQLEQAIDLREIKVKVGQEYSLAHQLPLWLDSVPVDKPFSTKGTVAELVAAVGPELAREMVVSMW
ncbi:MAG: Arginyl-tRNA--protein transferase 1 [Peltula sp. TS41687]|nr:MAG: Arginyl-tRNA--protein transferase 1 [Peltula sp. TS41687]